MGPVKLVEEDRVISATERVQKETNPVAAEERRGCNRAPKVKKKKANTRSDENMPISQKNVTRESVDARSGQKGLVVKTEDSEAPALKAAAGATPVDIRSLQVTIDVRSRGSTEVQALMERKWMRWRKALQV